MVVQLGSFMYGSNWVCCHGTILSTINTGEEMIRRAADLTVFLFYLAFGLLAIAIAMLILRDLKVPDTAAWVQAVGSILAILSAIWVSRDQHLKALIREDTKERQEGRNILLSLRDEFSVTSDGFAIAGGHLLDELKEGDVFFIEWYSEEKPFVVFDACASQIGKINNDDLRRDIIQAIMQARGLLLTLKMNTEYVRKHNHWILAGGLNNGGKQEDNPDWNVLLQFGKKLMNAHKQFKVNIEKLNLDIDEHLKK